MRVRDKTQFINAVRRFEISTPWVVIKPNWVSNNKGEYTEPEILDWLLSALEGKQKIVVESYTPWRGFEFKEPDSVSLERGRKYRTKYRDQDSYFLTQTGIAGVLEKHHVSYINITEEVWGRRCVSRETVKKILGKQARFIVWQELMDYVPTKLFEIRDKATFISLAKVKLESGLPSIYVSMSVKNLFGLIPHPSRWEPFHQQNHRFVPEVVRDIYLIYTSLFKNNLWVVEGIKTLVENYTEPNQKIVENEGLLFIGREGTKVDRQACVKMDIKPEKVPYLEILKD